MNIKELHENKKPHESKKTTHRNIKKTAYEYYNKYINI